MTSELYKTVKSLQKCEFNLKETMSVIIQSKTIFWCWGVSRKFNFDDKALCMKVSGHFHKGYVVITLDWLDTYIVTFVTTTGKIKKTIEMVYWDNLVMVIDSHIESEKGLL